MSHLTPYNTQSTVTSYSAGQSETEHMILMIRALGAQNKEILDMQEEGIQAAKKIAQIAPEAVTAQSERYHQRVKKLMEAVAASEKSTSSHLSLAASLRKTIAEQEASIVANTQEIDRLTKICNTAKAAFTKILGLIPNVEAVETTIREAQVI